MIDEDDVMNDEGDECESRAPSGAFTTTGMRASGLENQRMTSAYRIGRTYDVASVGSSLASSKKKML